MASLINRKGAVIHLANEFNNLSHGGRIGDIVKKVALRQKKMGLDVKVVVPKTPGMNLEGFEKKSDNLSVRIIDGVPVYVVGPELTSLYPTNGSAIDEYEHFAKGFISEMRKGSFGKISIVHAHDYSMGIALPFVRDFQVRSVFTIYDPKYDTIFTIKHGLSETCSDIYKESMHKEGLSGLKLGVLTSTVTTVWSDDYLENLGQGNYGDFLEFADDIKPFFRLGTHWKPWEETPIPDQAIDVFSRAYLQVLYGDSLKFSMNIGRETCHADAILASVTERAMALDNRGKKIQEAIENNLVNKSTEVRVVSRGVGTIHPRKAYGGNIGGLVQMFEALFTGKYDKNGVYYALLTGGVGERLMNICLAAAGIKGEVRLGHTTLNQVAIDQAKVISQQLPNGGKGYVVMFGNDNIIIPDGPLMVGENLLANATQKIFLLGQPERVRNIKDGKDINYLKELGIMLANARTGMLSSFYEKKIKKDIKGTSTFDVDSLEAELNDLSTDFVFKNTFYMVMSIAMAELFYKKYSQQTKKDGRPFHETYGPDWSKRFVEAVAVSKEQWMSKYKDDIQKNYDKEDWEMYWTIAQDMKEAAGGIGIVNIGQNAEWADVGTIKELLAQYFKLISSSSEERNIARKIMKLPIDRHVDCSYVEGVKVDGKNIKDADESNILISHSVFENGADIGKGCIIIDSYFTEHVTIPNNTVVIGSHIYKIGVAEDGYRPIQNAKKMVYCVHKAGEEDVLWLKDYVAVSSVFFHDGSSKLGEFPVNYTGKEVVKDASGQPIREPVLTHYIMNGKMKEQPVKGVGMSVEEVKDKYSVTKSRGAYDKLMARINKFLKDKGIAK